MYWIPKVTPSTVMDVGRADDDGLVAEAELAEDAEVAEPSPLRTLEGISLAKMLESTLEGSEVRRDVGLAVEAPVGKRLVGRPLRMLEMTPEGNSVKMPEGRGTVEKGMTGVRVVLPAPRTPETTLEVVGRPVKTLEGMSLARMLDKTLEGSEVRIEVGLAPDETPEGKTPVGRLLRMLDMTPEGSSVRTPVGRGTVEKGMTGVRVVLPAPSTPDTTLDNTPEGKSLKMLDTTPPGRSVRIPVGITDGTLPRTLDTTPVGKSDRMLEMMLVGRSVKIPVGRGRPEVTPPMIEVASPARDVAPPIKEVTSPAREVASVRAEPTTDVAPPTIEVASPAREVISPAREVASGIAEPIMDVAAPARDVAPPTRDVASPAREVASGIAEPTREVAAPARDVASPTREVASEARELGSTGRSLVMLATTEARLDTSEGRLAASVVRPVAAERTLDAAEGKPVKTSDGTAATAVATLEAAAGRSLADVRPAISERTLETTGLTVLMTLEARVFTPPTALVATPATLLTIPSWALAPMNCKPVAPRATIL